MMRQRSNLRYALAGINGLRSVSTAMWLFVLAGCNVGPNYTPPTIRIPSRYGPATKPTTRASNFTETSPPVAEWWTTLHDPELDRLVRLAEDNNLSVSRATARLVESRAALRLAGANELPSVKATAGYARVDTGSNGIGLGRSGGSGTNSGSVSVGTQRSGGGSSALRTGVFTTGLDASWELDIFGGTRRGVEAAAADYQASVEDRRDVLVSLTAEIARDYLQLRGLQDRLGIAKDNLAIEQDSLVLTQSLRQNGFSTELDVNRALTQVWQTRAALSPLTAAIAQQEHAIAVLVGAPPDQLAAELDQPTPVPSVTGLVSVGMPTDLLRRRPDIRRAERRIVAANARVGQAISDYYPKFSLTGDFGTDSSRFRELFDWESHYFILYPSVSWKLLDFGRTKASVDQERARREQSVIEYRDAILTALRDVEDAQVAYLNEQEHRSSLASAAKSASDSVVVAKEQYRQGVTDFLQVLEAQRDLLTIQDSLAQSDQAIATDLVALFKALGGGWEDEEMRRLTEAPPNATPLE